MKGPYRARRDHGLAPDSEPSPSTLPKVRPMSTVPSEDELSHIAMGHVLEYQPEEEEDEDDNRPPRSPLISTVSKGFQAFTKKMGYVPKPKLSGDTPRSGSASKAKEPKKPKESKKPKKPKNSEPEPKEPESPWRVFVAPAFNDDNDWPNGIQCIGGEYGTDKYHYYEDRRGVIYRTARGQQFGYVDRLDGKYRDVYCGRFRY